MRQAATRKHFHRHNHQICWYCGERARMTIDHQQPKSRGGTEARSNLVSACGSRNNEKADMTVEEYRATGAAKFDGKFYGEFVSLVSRSTLKYKLRDLEHVRQNAARFLGPI